MSFKICRLAEARVSREPSVWQTRAPAEFYLLYRQSDDPEISSQSDGRMAWKPRRGQGQGWYFLKPARCMPRLAASFFMNVFQTNPER